MFVSLQEIRYFPTERYCVRCLSTKCIIMCSSVCDHDTIILGDRTESKKVIIGAVQTTICNSRSCWKEWWAEFETVCRCGQQWTVLNSFDPTYQRNREWMLWPSWPSPMDVSKLSVEWQRVYMYLKTNKLNKIMKFKGTCLQKTNITFLRI
jgi:hypothetical protein